LSANVLTKPEIGKTIKSVVSCFVQYLAKVKLFLHLSCNKILHSNADSTNPKKYYNPLDAAPLNPKHDAWKLNIFKKYAEETFNNLVLYMALIVEELNASVQNAKEEEDWQTS